MTYIDSKNPNSAVNLANDRMQEALDDRLWEIYEEFGGFNGFDLLAGIESWIKAQYGFVCIRESRWKRVQAAERRIRKLKPIVTEMAETLQSPV